MPILSNAPGNQRRASGHNAGAEAVMMAKLISTDDVIYPSA